MSNGANVAGFWSYTRDDDDAVGGQITRLASRIRAEYKMLTGGEEINIFVDRDQIAWGEEWQRRIDESLDETTFFIPIVTPRYFRSEPCRRELITFLGHATSLGVAELVLPIYYVPVPALAGDSPEDEAVGIIKRTQYEDWTDLRLEDEDSRDYRRGVNRLAARLVEIASSVATSPPALELGPRVATSSIVTISGDDSPGFLDVLAGMEEAMPRWQAIVEEMGEITAGLGALADRGAADVARADAQGKGFAGRLFAARSFANGLALPAERSRELGQAYSAELLRIDAGVLTLIRLAPEQATTPEERAIVCEFFKQVRALSENSRESIASVSSFVESLSELESMSREVRAPIAVLRSGLQSVIDGQAITDEWLRLIDSSGFDCGDISTASGLELAT